MVTPEQQVAFASVAAQIIPTLLLALIADRSFSKSPLQNSPLFMFCTLTIAAMGEFLCLIGVFMTMDSDSAGTLILLSVVTMAWVLVAIIRPHFSYYWRSVILGNSPTLKFILERLFFDSVYSLVFFITYRNLDKLAWFAKPVLFLTLGFTIFLNVFWVVYWKFAGKDDQETQLRENIEAGIVTPPPPVRPSPVRVSTHKVAGRRRSTKP